MIVRPAEVIPFVLLMIVSLSVHEFAHAVIATWLGDTTAKSRGRLTLNPVSHVDPVGTLLIPAIGAMAGVPLVGWANPVPVSPERFRKTVNRRRGMALVAAAGPLSNLLQAVVGAVLLALIAPTGFGQRLLFGYMTMNVALFVFNMLPIAPLDGSRLTPPSMDSFQARVRPYSGFVLMAILIIPQVSYYLLRVPSQFIVDSLRSLFGT